MVAILSLGMKKLSHLAFSRWRCARVVDRTSDEATQLHVSNRVTTKPNDTLPPFVLDQELFSHA